MRKILLLAAISLPLTLCCVAARAADDAAARLCRSNPAFSMDVMRGVLQAQLDKDHDPALDNETPDQLATEAVEQGVGECAAALRQSPPLFATLSGLSGPDLQAGWDAYNTTCSDRGATRPQCVKAEIGAEHALKHMMAANQPAGARALVQTCALILKSDPAMADWRECVDAGLSVHAPENAVARCKTLVPWHGAATGAEAGGLITACLRAQ